jgi:hypothetical protein
MRDKHRALLEEARDALRALLRQTEPDPGLSLHHAYEELTRQLRRLDEHEILRHQAERDQYRARADAWTKTPMSERCHRILNALQGDHLTVRELTERLRAVHVDCDIYEYNVKSLAEKLVAQGELGRTKEQRVAGGTAFRWRYHRRVELSPESQAPARTLGSNGSGAGSS